MTDSMSTTREATGEPRTQPYVSCRAVSKRGYYCTRPKGHQGFHVAAGVIEEEGEYDRWRDLAIAHLRQGEPT